MQILSHGASRQATCSSGFGGARVCVPQHVVAWKVATFTLAVLLPARYTATPSRAHKRGGPQRALLPASPRRQVEAHRHWGMAGRLNTGAQDLPARERHVFSNSPLSGEGASAFVSYLEEVVAPAAVSPSSSSLDLAQRFPIVAWCVGGRWRGEQHNNLAQTSQVGKIEHPNVE